MLSPLQRQLRRLEKNSPSDERPIGAIGGIVFDLICQFKPYDRILSKAGRDWMHEQAGDRPYQVADGIRTGDQLSAFLEPLRARMSGLVFRGHADARWELRSRFQRVLDRNPFESARPRSCVYDQVLKLGKRMFGIPDHVQEFDGQVWAMLQHYGVSTPLLDWTESADVALFFALQYAPDNGGKAAALFVANPQTINTHPDANKKRPWNGWKFVETTGFFDSRIMAQKGLFMLQGIEPKPFEESLIAYEFPAASLLKICIPRLLRTEVLNDLKSRGVTWEVLFPRGADDLCRQIEQELLDRIHHAAAGAKEDLM